MIKRFLQIFILLTLIQSCGSEEKKTTKIIPVKKEKIVKEFGFTLNDFNVKKDTINRGDSFGLILENNNLFYPKIFNIVSEVKKVFDIRKINIGNHILFYHQRIHLTVQNTLFINQIQLII